MRKSLRVRQSLLIPVTIERLEEGGFLVTSDELQGLLAEGETVEEALAFAQDVAHHLLQSHKEHGIPPPSTLVPSLRRPVKAALFLAPTP